MTAERVEMDERNEPGRQRQHSVITAEERRLIDEAVAKGRVTRIPTGASAFERTYIWKPGRKNSMKLVLVDDGTERKPGEAWRRQIAEQGRLAKARNSAQGRKRK
ncbi:hypothetical protein [Ruegeria sp.]|uniref:hypothetical protein n=1 Tax=Ruegeria sp. TaxID=1879320 RepID=UPI003AFFC5D5